jgi:hypothetical protein
MHRFEIPKIYLECMDPSNGLNPTTAEYSFEELLNLSMFLSFCFTTIAASSSADFSNVGFSAGLLCRKLTTLVGDWAGALEEDEPPPMGAPMEALLLLFGGAKVEYACSTIPVVGGELITLGLTSALLNFVLNQKEYFKRWLCINFKVR